ncbi:MAG: Trm112 family protein [Alphaproteobacteria bacterium]
MTDNAQSSDDTTTGARGAEGASDAIDPRLLELLVCPLTKQVLRYDRKRQELVSEAAGLAYPIRDGIPIMLIDEARVLGEDEAIPDELKADPEP